MGYDGYNHGYGGSYGHGWGAGVAAVIIIIIIIIILIALFAGFNTTNNRPFALASGNFSAGYQVSEADLEDCSQKFKNCLRKHY